MTTSFEHRNKGKDGRMSGFPVTGEFQAQRHWISLSAGTEVRTLVQACPRALNSAITTQNKSSFKILSQRAYYFLSPQYYFYLDLSQLIHNVQHADSRRISSGLPDPLLTLPAITLLHV